jgi:hypothetical protein
MGFTEFRIYPYAFGRDAWSMDRVDVRLFRSIVVSRDSFVHSCIVGTSRSSLPDLPVGTERHEEIETEDITPPSLIIFSSVSRWRRWLVKCLAK